MILMAALCFSPQSSFSKELSAADIVKDYSPSIVTVAATSPKGLNFGSGFIVNSNGLIVTNFHILQTAVKIGIKLSNGKTYDHAKLLRFDTPKDIAVLKIDAKNLNPVILGDSDKIVVGEGVVTIGNPLGLEASVSDGIISSRRSAKKGLKLLQITTPISSGSSGGPLFNLKGEVVGITTATNKKGQNINFAVPINYAKPIIFLHQKGESISGVKNDPNSKETFLYTIKPKDTLFSLAKKFNTSVQTLMELNSLSNPRILSGQKIKVPSRK